MTTVIARSANAPDTVATRETAIIVTTAAPATSKVTRTQRGPMGPQGVIKHGFFFSATGKHDKMADCPSKPS